MLAAARLNLIGCGCEDASGCSHILAQVGPHTIHPPTTFPLHSQRDIVTIYGIFREANERKKRGGI
jgi:hypothetical protein